MLSKREAGLIEKGQGENQKYRSTSYKGVPQELQSSLERVVVAGKRILYAPQMKGMIEKQLKEKGPIEKKLADGVLGLIILLESQSKPSLPAKVIIPAAVELLYEVADFLSEAGLIPELTPD